MKNYLTIFAFTIIIAVTFTNVNAQVNDQWVCIVQPETILTSPEHRYRDAAVLTSDLGYPRFVLAKPFISTEWRSNNNHRKQEAIIAAIQYSIHHTFAGNIVIRFSKLANYLPNAVGVPNITVENLLFNYFYNPNQRIRSENRNWLLQMAGSPINRVCNNGRWVLRNF